MPCVIDSQVPVYVRMIAGCKSPGCCMLMLYYCLSMPSYMGFTLSLLLETISVSSSLKANVCSRRALL